MIKSLIGQVKFSEDGSTERVKEKATFMLFLDLLYDIQGKKLCSNIMKKKTTSVGRKTYSVCSCLNNSAILVQ